MPDQVFRTRHDDEGKELVVTVDGVDVARYVYRPDTPIEESPKPYLHPVKALSGAPLGLYRPWDHRWHKGIQMTWSHVSGDNFWGGPTFEPDAPGHGYVWRDNHGRQLHTGFAPHDAEGAEIVVRQNLAWIAANGQTWIDETRVLRFHSADHDRGIWALDFASDLTCVHTEPLRMGSPTTHGRPNAGYTGLFWRGPRAFTGGEVVAADGSHGDDVMGATAAWAALSGEHDEVDGAATVLALAGRSSGAVPIKWFARHTPFACLNPSPAFDAELKLTPGETLELRHRFVFVDRKLEPAELDRLAAEFAL
jgi:hypothetical protein